MIRIGADVGGTFTDVVLARGDGDLAAGEIHTAKLLTTHDAPERAILDGIARVLHEAEASWADIGQVVHGTTLATNALIERRGAFTALVTTEGFRDVVETRTESRFEQYDLDIVLPSPLVDREHRLVVRERIGPQGEVLVPFDEDRARSVVERLVQVGYEAVAVGFLHSYRNAAHERRLRELLLDARPGIAVSISSEVSPQMRELERFTTVCANAYVQPLIATYLRRLRDELLARGSAGPLHLIHSGGGLIDVETAAAFPVRLVESGPAGGAIFAADLARRYGRDRVLSFDMGGTTAKISLVEDHAPRTATTFEVDRTARFTKGSGMTISIPVIDMIEIGAGGGSIATVDALGQIRIGPRSAGSEPGPAAYDLGGTEPTVTDADVELGRLHPDTFGAPGITLAPERARDALDRAVGSVLGVDPRDAAVGVAEVVDENMSNAARVHAVENGIDLSGHTMIAFGGAAPVHAARLLDKLGLEELIVPPGAAVGSAIGFLRAPFAYEAVRSFYTTTSSFDAEAADALVADLADEAMSFVRSGTDADVTLQRRVAMRYQGQGWEIQVELPPGGFDHRSGATLAETFTKAYVDHFGRAIDDVEIEAVSWSVRVASVVTPPPPIELRRGHDSAATPVGTRRLHDTTSGEEVDAAVVERATLVPGTTITGPAVIVEPQTTTVLGGRHRADVQRDGSLLVTRGERP
jgi:N-methylhydantoinase A